MGVSSSPHALASTDGVWVYQAAYSLQFTVLMLRFDLFTPPTRTVLFATVGLTAIAALCAQSEQAPAPHMVTVFPEPANVVSVQQTAHEEVVAASPSRELQLLLYADGTTYMKLEALTPEQFPKHGTPRLVDDDFIRASIATVKLADVPAAHREWQGRTVNVDGTCTTTVTGFAIVSRLTGETSYSEVEEGGWTPRNVLENGSAVLAAKLAGCVGKFARDAALPAPIIPTRVGNTELLQQARAALIASQPSIDAQREYAELGGAKKWWNDDFVHFAMKAVRHPTTNVTWVSAHAYVEHGCGDAEVNVWGLFRVEQDGSLTAVQLRKLGDLWQIDQLIDIDGDGELELIGNDWLGLDTVVTTGSGDELERLSVSFFGCPC